MNLYAKPPLAPHEPAVELVLAVEKDVVPADRADVGQQLEVEALLRAVERGDRARDVAILRFLLLRVQELCDLVWSDVRIWSRKGRALVRRGKGSKQREIPLNKEAREALESLGYWPACD